MSNPDVRPAVIALAALLSSCSGQEGALSSSERSKVETPAAAAELLTKKLGSASAVQFYFFTSTGEYSLNPSDIKKVSTIRVYRSCGNNCARFMEPVIRHLRNSASYECQAGQEDALIEFAPKEMIIYSYSGRVIRYKGSCYLNKESVHVTLRSSPFYFERN